MIDFALQVRGLTKRFGTKLAVDNLSLDVARGGIFGFLGLTGPARPPPSI